LKQIQKKRELQSLNNLKKDFFGVLFVRVPLRQPRVRESLGLIEKHCISD
jgi:hypothetical protein